MGWLAGLMALAGCNDDGTLDRAREDTGIRISDGGVNAPLALQKGWVLTYRARLTVREGRREKNTGYELTVTIDDVDDRGAMGDSTVTISATGRHDDRIEQNWDPSAGQDSWVARVGPADPADQVSPRAITVDLDDGPQGATFPPKSIPSDRFFFLDMRRIDQLRTEFVQRFSTQSPTSLSPEGTGKCDPNGDWTLALKGPEDLQIYPPPVNVRDVTFQYDPRGFLTKVVEKLGDSFDNINPNGSFTLELDAASCPP